MVAIPGIAIPLILARQGDKLRHVAVAALGAIREHRLRDNCGDLLQSGDNTLRHRVLADHIRGKAEEIKLEGLHRVIIHLIELTDEPHIGVEAGLRKKKLLPDSAITIMIRGLQVVIYTTHDDLIVLLRVLCAANKNNTQNNATHTGYAGRQGRRRPQFF